MSDWTCGRCGTRVLSGLSHACHYQTGGNISYSEQVALWTSEKLRADTAEAEVARLRAAIEKLRDEVEASPLRESFVARRLTEILGGES